jgi:hypothetical protein
LANIQVLAKRFKRYLEARHKDILIFAIDGLNGFNEVIRAI